MQILDPNQIFNLVPLLEEYQKVLPEPLEVSEFMEEYHTSREFRNGVVIVDDVNAPKCFVHAYKFNKLYWKTPVLYIGTIYVSPDSRSGDLSEQLITFSKNYGKSIGCEEIWCAGVGDAMAKRWEQLGGEYMEHVIKFK